MGGVMIRHGLLAMLPLGPRLAFERAATTQYALNARRLELFARLLAALRAEGIKPVLLKSSALFSVLHPRLAYSQMSDVDAWIPADRLPACGRVLRALGYVEFDRQADAWDYRDATGTLRLDLHHRFRLYEHLPDESLFVGRQAAFPGLGRVRVFEPNAMLAHLVYHLNEHRRQLGYQLRWLLDVAYALQAWRDELRLEPLHGLLGSRRRVGQVLRAVRFVADELDGPVPTPLLAAAGSMEGFTLEEVFRSQRTDPWPLWRPRGWLRVASCALGRSRLDDRLYPRPGDPFARLLDRLREARDLAAAERL
jgi:hypothetical protein